MSVPAADARPTPVDRCPRCLCGNCGGRLDEHRDVDCECEGCTSWSFLGCSVAKFTPEEGVVLIAGQLSVLLSSHLDEAARFRCYVASHAAHHALRDYDQQKESDHA